MTYSMHQTYDLITMSQASSISSSTFHENIVSNYKKKGEKDGII